MPSKKQGSNTQQPGQQRVLSGMRPTGRLHLGHLHGVLNNWLRLQEEYECFFFVADWHALTTHYGDSSIFEDNVLDMVIDWLAAGVDPEKAALFVQSRVPQHAELHLLLSMVTPLSWLERVPSYKEIREQHKQQHSQQDRQQKLDTYGFLGYPLLQAADILIYRADHVPVGEDQVPHVELTREIARRFNHLYGRGPGNGESSSEKPAEAILTEPKSLLTAAPKMPGLDGQKMSKSYGNTISLREPTDSVVKKIKTMPTDPARVRRSDPGDPEKCPVWQLHQVYSDRKTQDWVMQGCRSADIGCIECKQPVIDRVAAELAPIQAAAQPYEKDPQQVKDIIARGCQQAQAAAQETLTEVRQAIGITRW